jgi:hypothetical protein
VKTSALPLYVGCHVRVSTACAGEINLTYYLNCGRCSFDRHEGTPLSADFFSVRSGSPRCHNFHAAEAGAPALPFLPPLPNSNPPLAGAFYRRARGEGAVNSRCFCQQVHGCRIPTYFNDQVTGRLAARSGWVCANFVWLV